jgi:hypothetical protein
VTVVGQLWLVRGLLLVLVQVLVEVLRLVQVQLG